MTAKAKKNLFEYSPYENTLDDSYKNTSARNLSRIADENNTFTDSTFTIALLSDSHYYFDELKAAVQHINAQSNIKFLILTGDITDQGLIKEYILMHDILGGLNIPYVTVIGNHDYLSDGAKIYDQMFGARNYSFVFANMKFILFDDVFWESKKVPDFTWLQNELSNNTAYARTIVCSHIPPNTDQFDDASEQTYASLLHDNHVSMSINGHLHGYFSGNLYADSIPYLFVPYVKARSLVLLTVSKSGLNLESTPF